MIKYFLIFLSLVNAEKGFTTTITWDEIKSLAKDNPSQKSSIKTYEASDANLKQTYSSFLPKLSVSASKNNNKKTVSGLATSTKQETNTIATSASINLFNGFSNIATVRGARASFDEAKENQRIASAEIRYELRIAYFNLYIQQEKVKLCEKVLKRQLQNEKLISIKYHSGTEAKWNVQLNKAETEKAEFNLKASREELEQAKNEIARLVEINQKDIIAVAPTDRIFEDIKFDIESLQENPRMLKSLHQEKKLSQDKIVAKSLFLPSIDLSYTISKQKVENNPKIENKTWEITATWNLFNGFSDFHKVQQANALYEAASLESEYTKKSLETKLKSKVSDLEIKKNKIPIVKNLREATEARLNTVSAQYRTGLKSYLEWEQAESHLVEAEQIEINTKKDALFALAEWENLIGKTLDEK